MHSNTKKIIKRAALFAFGVLPFLMVLHVFLKRIAIRSDTGLGDILDTFNMVYFAIPNKLFEIAYANDKFAVAQVSSDMVVKLEKYF